MKKISLLRKSFYLLGFVLYLLSVEMHGEQIGSITLVPASPTSTDTLKFYVNFNFSSSNCAHDAITTSISGNTIGSSAVHCLGMLDMICNHTDTIIVTPKPNGNYMFIYTLNTGQGDVPCTPGIVSDDVDTLNFTIGPSTDILENVKETIALFPNPARSNFNIKLDEHLQNGIYTITILDALGRSVYSKSIEKNSRPVEFDLPNGIYIVEVTDQATTYKRTSKLMVEKQE